MEIEYIIKRDFSTKPFSLDKITGAIHKAMNAVGNGSKENAQDVALSVYQSLIDRKNNDFFGFGGEFYFLFTLFNNFFLLEFSTSEVFFFQTLNGCLPLEHGSD